MGNLFCYLVSQNNKIACLPFRGQPEIGVSYFGKGILAASCVEPPYSSNATFSFTYLAYQNAIPQGYFPLIVADDQGDAKGFCPFF